MCTLSFFFFYLYVSFVVYKCLCVCVCVLVFFFLLLLFCFSLIICFGSIAYRHVFIQANRIILWFNYSLSPFFMPKWKISRPTDYIWMWCNNLSFEKGVRSPGILSLILGSIYILKLIASKAKKIIKRTK